MKKHARTTRLERVALIYAAVAFIGTVWFLFFAQPAQCQGDWCPPIDCFGGDCGQCICLRDAYPDPGYCVSLEQ